MQTEITGRNVQIDDGLRELVERKLGKLEKFLEEPLEARVTLATERYRQTAELHVSHHDGVLQATEETDGPLRDAVQRVIDNVVEQARRAHQKLVDKRRRFDHHRGGDQRWPVEVLEQESVVGGRVPRVIEQTHLDVKPMTIEEAALELDGSELGFVAFVDASTRRVSVLYKRKDQHYGLIAPEL
jgi:putative sigma-54 modulation protein